MLRPVDQVTSGSFYSRITKHSWDLKKIALIVVSVFALFVAVQALPSNVELENCFSGRSFERLESINIFPLSLEEVNAMAQEVLNRCPSMSMEDLDLIQVPGLANAVLKLQRGLS